ncbi:MAG: hypothetical protein Q4A78_01185 [Peptostreptococcaceae bacterium]|nr:hypothetical protein [Peptostreptococcaceae bacterium]
MDLSLPKILKIRSFRNLCHLQSALAAVFCVLMQLLQDDQVRGMMSGEEYTLPIWFAALIAVLSVFLFLFERYADLSIFEGQAKAYGILISTGYSRKKLQAALLKTDLIRFFSSMAAGIFIGSLGYIFLLHLSGLQRGAADFSLSPAGYLPLFLVFTPIRLFHLKLRLRRVGSMEVAEMIRFEREEKPLRRPALFLGAGVLLLFFGFYFAKVYRSESYGFVMAFLPMLCFVLAADSTVRSFRFWFEKGMKIFPYAYFRNLFFISQLRVHYRRYAKLLSASAILILFGLHILSMNLMTMRQPDRYAQENPYDFILLEEERGEFLSREIEKFEREFFPYIESAALVFIEQVRIRWEGEDYTLAVDLLSESGYEELTGEALDLSGKETLILTQKDKEYYEMQIQEEKGIVWGFQPPGETKGLIGGREQPFVIIGEIWREVYNTDDQERRSYIVSDEYYRELSRELGGRRAEYFVKVRGETPEEKREEMCQALRSSGKIVVEKEKALAEKRERKRLVTRILFAPVLLLFAVLLGFILLRIGQNIRRSSGRYENLLFLGYTRPLLYRELKKEIAALLLIPFSVGTLLSVIYSVSVSENAQGLAETIGLGIAGFALIEWIVYRGAVSFWRGYFLKKTGKKR